MPLQNDNGSGKNSDLRNGGGWFVYMIRCDDDSLYTGITTDMARRWNEHCRIDRQRSGRCKEIAGEAANTLRESALKSSRGAKFFRTRKPKQLAYIESGHDRSSAARREAAIKRLPRAAKLQLLTADHNELHTLDRALLPMPEQR
jgi:putative endonuclease